MSLAFPAPATASLPEPEAACAHTRRGKWGEAQVTPATRPGGEAAVLASARGSENLAAGAFRFAYPCGVVSFVLGFRSGKVTLAPLR